MAWDKAYLRTKWYADPSNRLATTYQRYKEDNDPVAQGEQLLVAVAKKVLISDKYTAAAVYTV